MTIQELDIRWKQRFANLTRSKNILDTIVGIDIQALDPVMIAGWIHIFDLVFELSWKTLRDYMLAQGESESLGFTREVLSVALTHGLIADGDIWLEMLTDRNSSTHEYDEQNALEVIENIQKRYLPEIQTLYAKLSQLT